MLKKGATESPEACLALMIRLDWLEQDAQSRPGENLLALAMRVVDQLAAVENGDETCDSPDDSVFRARAAAPVPTACLMVYDGAMPVARHSRHTVDSAKPGRNKMSTKPSGDTSDSKAGESSQPVSLLAGDWPPGHFVAFCSR